MKKISIILLFFISLHIFGQVPPPYINYQGLARDNSGNPIIGAVGLKFDLHQTTAGGTNVFSETHSATTNAFGIFNVQIGKNNPSSFALINWGTNDFFLEVSMDPLGGTSYTTIGTQQLVSVPYALYAKSAGNSTSYNAGSNVTFSGPANSPTINSNPSLSLGAGNVLSISGSGSPVTLPTTSLTATPNVTLTNFGAGSYDLKVPNYVAGNNITIVPPTSGNNYTINASGTATNTPFSLQVNSPHSVTPGPASVLSIVAPTINITGGGGVVTSNIFPNYSINIPTIVVTPTTGGLSFFQNGSTSTITVGGPPSPWTTSISTVYLVNTTDNVGIGTTNSTAKLTVTTNIATDAILAQSAGANGILATSNSSGPTDAGVFGSNSGAGHGLRGETISTNTLSAGVFAANNGMGNGVIGITGSTNSASSGVKGKNNLNGAGVYGENLAANASNFAHGVKGITNSSGALASGVNGINSGNGAGVYGENTKSITTSGNGHGVFGKSGCPDINVYGVYGQNIGSGSGVYGLTSSTAFNAAGVSGKNVGQGDGVYGETNATAGFAAAVHGEGLASTPGMMARNVSSSASGSASGIRAITNSSSSNAAGVHGENLAMGAAVKASLPTGLVAGALNAALLLENGHIKATAVTGATAGTYTFGGLTSGVNGIGPSVTNANDVRGIISFYTPNSITAVTSSGYIEQEVLFAKPYSVPPIVTIAPLTDMLNFSYMVKTVSASSFVIKVFRSSNSATPISAPNNTLLQFSYMVIE